MITPPRASHLRTATVAVLMLSLPLHPVIRPVRAETSAVAQQWLPWLEAGGYYGNARTRGETALWLPFWQSQQSVVFADLRGKLFEAGAQEGNFALGMRTMHGPFNFGGWAGYDTRHSEYQNRFNQIAGGFEALSDDFDFRLNYYIPINRTEEIGRHTQTDVTSLASSQIQFDETSASVLDTVTTTTRTTTRIMREHALFGIDAEVGVRLPLQTALPAFGLDAGLLAGLDMRLYAGGFYFDSKDIDTPLAGPRLRLEMRLEDIVPSMPGSALTAEAEYQYDRIRDNQFEAGLRLRIPLGGSTHSPRHKRQTLQSRRMMAGLERDTDIVHQARASTSAVTTNAVTTSRERVVDAHTGRPFGRISVVDSKTDLGSAIKSAGPNGIVIASGSAGAFNATGISLLPGQTLIGGGSIISLKSARSGRLFQFSAPGLRPTLHGTGKAPVLVVSSDSKVSGIDIVGAGQEAGATNAAIMTAGKHTSGFSITDVDISRTGGSGIVVHSYASNYLIDNVRLRDITGGAGISIENENKGFTISNSSFSGITLTSGDAIHMSRANVGILTNNHFRSGIADHVLRMRDANRLTGVGNINASGRPLCQQFGGGNIVDVTFNGLTGCR